MFSFSSEIYEVLALAARYVFALLGVLIVLRSFAWLLSSHREKKDRLRRLPDAGMIGEMVVLSGSADLPENTALPVPREGVLGFVRSCDITVPCAGVKRRHLDFVWQDDAGLLVHPRSGCDALVDGQELNVRSGVCAMRHGSFLQIGSALLRLRVFAGLDPNAGFDNPAAEPDPAYDPALPPEAVPMPGPGMPGPMMSPDGVPVPAPMPGGMPGWMPPAGPEAPFVPAPPEAEENMPPARPVPKSTGWKEDWSD